MKRVVMLTGNRDSPTRPLNFHYALRLKMAEYWLRLGETDVAWHEVNLLPAGVMGHPEVRRVREEVSARLKRS
jgi:hypothetical protein